MIESTPIWSLSDQRIMLCIRMEIVVTNNLVFLFHSEHDTQPNELDRLYVSNLPV